MARVMGDAPRLGGRPQDARISPVRLREHMTGAVNGNKLDLTHVATAEHLLGACSRSPRTMCREILVGEERHRRNGIVRTDGTRASSKTKYSRRTGVVAVAETEMLTAMRNAS